MNARHNLLGTGKQDMARMVAALRHPACYSHVVQDVILLETHISWVILAGSYAYKIKKPVNLGFLDFSSLAARRHYCEEELRLNRRLAPDLYLEVVPVTGEFDAPRVGGDGPVLEYAVKMRRFAQTALLDARVAGGTLYSTTVDSLARKIAAFHAAAPNALTTPGIEPAAGVLPPALENFRQMLPLLESADDLEALARLRAWTLAEHRHPARLLAQRLAEGHIRECHGDLHLGNIVLLDGEPTPFDCIEFNPALRWMDTMSEAAFPVMDLAAHGRGDLAHVFLDSYLEAGGDYGGIPVLPFYLAYRAVVRAKISLLRGAQTDVTAQQRQRAVAACRNYMALAQSYSRPRRGAVIITHGLSGSGKTTLTQPLIADLGALRVRSDVERKRMHGLPPLARTSSPVAAGIYTPQATDRIYTLLCSHARSIVGTGFSALIDATFLKRDQRAMFRKLAQEMRVPFVIISANAPQDVLRARLADRAANGGEASEATLAVLETQIASREPLNADELVDAVAVDASADVAAGTRALVSALRQRL